MVLRKILLIGFTLVGYFCSAQYTLAADTTVTTTWNLSGGVLKVLPGVKIHGTGTVTNYWMDAYQNQNIFDTTVNYSGILGSTSGKVSAIWFGVSTSNADNWRYFARAIAATINKGITLHIPAGTYTNGRQMDISNYYNGDYQQCQLTIEGDYKMNGQATGTVINCTNIGGQAVGVQLGKGCIIRGLQIIGTFVSPSTSNLTNYYNTTYANYTDKNGLCSTFYSGIAIDPYNPTSGTSGSTAITIEDCYISGFTNAINISCAGALNAEMIHIRYCSFGMCRTCVQSNKGQEKMNVIEHCMAWSSCFCFFQSGYNNAQSGYYHIKDINIAGNMVQVFHVNQQGWFPLKADHIYAEGISSIGDLYTGSMGIDISDCTFQFVDPATIGQHYLAYTNSTNVIFRSCDFTFFNGSHTVQLPFNGIQTFDACSFDGVYSNIATGSIFYPNCQFRN